MRENRGAERICCSCIGGCMFSENSTDTDLEWTIEVVVDSDTNAEMQVEISGYKYPTQNLADREAFSEHTIDCYLSIGHRWGSYGNISIDTPGKLDQIIMALQRARDELFDLSVDFPNKDFSLETFQNRRSDVRSKVSDDDGRIER